MRTVFFDFASPGETVAKFSRFLFPHLCIEMVSARTGRPYSVAKMAGYNALTFDWPRLKSLYGQCGKAHSGNRRRRAA